MAKNRKKKGPKPTANIPQKTWKDKWRRVIRVMMVAVAIFLLLVAVGIPVANNAIALGLEKDLKAMPLPENTRLVESSSVAEKLTGNGNGMQYFGALLLKSDLTDRELLAHYAGVDESELFTHWANYYTVLPYTGQDSTDDNVVKHLPLTSKEAGEGYYVVYYIGAGDSPLQEWLDLDIRGH